MQRWRRRPRPFSKSSRTCVVPTQKAERGLVPNYRVEVKARLKEKRVIQRLAAPVRPNRVSHGCIFCSLAFVSVWGRAGSWSGRRYGQSAHQTTLTYFLTCVLVTGGDSLPQPELSSLSEQLVLDNLWDTLGQCLSELGKTTDSHAVLILQPAVEAFFLVHGTGKQEGTAGASEDQRAAQRLSSVSSEHFAVPASPGPMSPGLLSPSRQMSVTSVTSDLPSDTQKFLRFAGQSKLLFGCVRC